MKKQNEAAVRRVSFASSFFFVASLFGVHKNHWRLSAGVEVCWCVGAKCKCATRLNKIKERVALLHFAKPSLLMLRDKDQ